MLLQRALTLGHAAAGLGLVDDVVVVERAEVDELARDPAGDRGVGAAAARAVLAGRAGVRRRKGSAWAAGASRRRR